MKQDRTVAGLRCSEVLARLDGYVAGTLEGAERAALAAHVGACANCADFGERYARTLAAIRQAHSDAPVAVEAKARLLARLAHLR